MCMEITTKDGKVLKPDKMADYGAEKDYLAYVGNCIYIKRLDNKYEILTTIIDEK